MDWWTTNDPEKIKAFLNSHGSEASGHDFSGWDHYTERPEDVSMFGFDDVAGQFHMTAGDVTKSFNSSILPILGESGIGYAGAYVYSYSGDGGLYNAGYNAAQFGEISAFAAEFIAAFDPNNYFDGVNNWNVDTCGRLTGVNIIQESQKGGGGKAAAKALKGLVQQATRLSHKIGKNSVKMTTPNVMYDYDLRGPAHKGVPTPHVQRSLPNVDAKGVLHWNKDSK